MRNRKGQRGSTLIEVMIAGVILILGLVGVVQLLIAGASNERRGEQAVQGALLAEQIMEEAVTVSFASMAAACPTPPCTVNLADFEDSSHRKYTRRYTVTDGGADPNQFFTLTVQVDSQATPLEATRHFTGQTVVPQ